MPIKKRGRPRKYRGMTIGGIEVEDATKPVMLHIRDADTKSGKKDPGGCAAAKAACREDGVIEARVYRSKTYLLTQNGHGKKKWLRYNTPGAIRSEIISFDRGGTFEPDDYTLQVVNASQRLGTTAGRLSPGTGKHSGKNTPHIVKGIRPIGPRGGWGTQA